jgi:tetratricopeptide (TPR) repeat protein
VDVGEREPETGQVTSELDEKVYAKVLRRCARMNGLFEARDYQGALREAHRALTLLPEPRGQWQAATALLAGAGDALFMLGRYAEARVTFREAVSCPDGLGNAFIHLRLGQLEFELGNTEQAKNELARAYMSGGDEVFANEDPKYWRFIRESLRPPAQETGE